MTIQRHNYNLEMTFTVDGDMIIYPTHDQYVAGALRDFGEYSPSEVKLLQSICKPDWTCIDVGANIGTVALALAKVSKHVIAIEPQLLLSKLILANAALQGLGNIDVVYAAVGSTNGKVHIPAFSYTTFNNYGAIDSSCWTSGLEVDRITLDGLAELSGLNKYPVGVNLIKIDVEGMEKQVLEGAKVLIQESKPVLWVENDKIPQRDELIRYIKSIGYTPYWVVTTITESEPMGSHPLDSNASFNMLCVTPGPNYINCQGLRECNEGDENQSCPYVDMFRYDNAQFS